MIAVLDANVLYPALVRDILLRLAYIGLFDPKWTATINEEWTRNLLANRPTISQSSLLRVIETMNTAFPKANVEDHLDMVDSLTLPDPDDRHVLAAASPPIKPQIMKPLLSILLLTLFQLASAQTDSLHQKTRILYNQTLFQRDILADHPRHSNNPQKQNRPLDRH